MPSPIASKGLAGAFPVPMPAGDVGFIREVLGRVGDKWALLVIAALQDRKRRYSELRDAIPGISQRMLAVTLRQLVQDGLATRTSYPEVPPRVEYALTPLGASLLEVVCPLVGWAAAHHTEIRDHRARNQSKETADADVGTIRSSPADGQSGSERAEHDQSTTPP